MGKDNFRFDNSQPDDFLTELLNRFEQMIQNRTEFFFDLDEFLELIDYYTENSQLYLAKKAIDTALKIYPDNTDILISKSYYLNAAGKTSQALDLLKDILKKDTKNVDALICAGDISKETGMHSESIKYYEKALKHANESKKVEIMHEIVALYDELGQHNKMLPYLKELITLEPYDASVLNMLTYNYSILGRYEEGIHFFEKMTNSDPFNEYVWFNLGCLYFDLDLYEKAIEAFEYVLAIEPEFTSAALRLGEAFLSIEQIDSAIKVCENIISYDKTDPDIYSFIGNCYLKKNLYKTAIYYFKKAIKLNSESFDAQLGLISAFSAEKKFNTAYKYILKLTEYNNKWYKLFFFKAFLEEVLGLFEESIKSLHKGLEINPLCIDEWLLLSEIYIDRFDDYATAMSVLRDAISHNPDNIEILFRGAAVCFEAGFKNEGIEWLHNAMSVDSSKYDIMFDFNSALQKNQTILRILNFYIK